MLFEIVLHVAQEQRCTVSLKRFKLKWTLCVCVCARTISYVSSKCAIFEKYANQFNVVHHFLTPLAHFDPLNDPRVVLKLLVFIIPTNRIMFAPVLNYQLFKKKKQKRDGN